VRPTSEVEEADDQHHRLGEVREWREAEALAALNAARRSRADGNVRKARSIIEVFHVFFGEKLYPTKI
jgi:hypothetical protein